MKTNNISIYVSQPKELTGYYEVARWNELTHDYESMTKEIFLCEEAAKQRARELNQSEELE